MHTCERQKLKTRSKEQNIKLIGGKNSPLYVIMDGHGMDR